MTTPFPFTAGQTLTAAQLNAITTLPINDQTASYTLVVGDVGKRVIMNVATANTVTVNNSIFAAGDTIFIANKGAGTSTITAGAGVTINTADSLALVQHQSGVLVAQSASVFAFYPSTKTVSAGGLVVVKAQTTFSAAASVTADSVFTSTYETYLVRVRITTNAGNLLYRLRASGTSSSTDYGHIRARDVSGTGLSATAQSAQTSGFVDGALAGATVRAVDIILNGPQLALETPWLAHGYGVNTDDVTFDAYWTGGLHNVATAYDGIELLSSSGNITGNYTIYGYAKS